MIYCYAWKKFLKVYYICYECTVYNDLFHLDGISEGHKSEQWTKQVDRGDVSHDVFMTFYSFQMELRKHLTADSNYSLKDRALQSILSNEDVLFHVNKYCTNSINDFTIMQEINERMID